MMHRVCPVPICQHSTAFTAVDRRGADSPVACTCLKASNLDVDVDSPPPPPEYGSQYSSFRLNPWRRPVSSPSKPIEYIPTPFVGWDAGSDFPIIRIQQYPQHAPNLQRIPRRRPHWQLLPISMVHLPQYVHHFHINGTLSLASPHRNKGCYIWLTRISRPLPNSFPIPLHFILHFTFQIDNPVNAAIVAIVASNAVLGIFIFASVLEDKGVRQKHEAVVREFESKKSK